VHFDEGQRDREQCIPQRDARMGECTRIDDQERRAIVACRVDTLDEFVLGVALEGDEFVTGSLRCCRGTCG